ncbi:uncharacterized protein BX663DRAFT_500770 [Cokeromyces recurvatus]|uniref:uncharacterized protein n=1 Tax=Cokeromyces recurvatus TaxID=90255 RepID=UPI00221E8142|nr:uncharacterized protein BX663DRAFT_500770 [Cokeromyces recurvatus]KAI7905748.1 hypothetical protein BX663DRAFT_500770 [Cokeromyces recurvatus]
MPYTPSRLLTASNTVTSPSFSAPLSLQERRQRNKAASAKYRAKKNQQHGEMRTLISSLTKENDLLQRQLENARQENNRLKATCDRLRGKILAEKMLKKLLGHPPSQQDDNEMTQTVNNKQPSSYNDYYFNQEKTRQISLNTFKKRYDEDIDFDDGEEEEEEDIGKS